MVPYSTCAVESSVHTPVSRREDARAGGRVQPVEWVRRRGNSDVEARGAASQREQRIRPHHRVAVKQVTCSMQLVELGPRNAAPRRQAGRSRSEEVGAGRGAGGRKLRKMWVRMPGDGQRLLCMLCRAPGFCFYFSLVYFLV